MIQELSYIGFASPRAGEAKRFGPEVLGLQLAPDEPDGIARFRMDDAAYRISVEDGVSDDLLHVGWGVAGPRELEAVAARLEGAGLRVVREGSELASRRCVVGLISFRDPYGWRHEVSWGQAFRQGTFQPGRSMSGFVTGDQGLGHIVFFVPDLAEAEQFYVDLLGFKLTDEIRYMGLGGRFYHCGSRHHSLALVQGPPGMTGVPHLMLQVRNLDDVGIALDLYRRTGEQVLVSLGRHCNDHMVSFYGRTPLGFDVEYGWGAVDVESGVHSARLYDTGDIWGHHPAEGPEWPMPSILRPIGAPVAEAREGVA